MSDSELLRPKQIGTFLRYAIVDAYLSGFDENIELMLVKARQLFMNGNADLLLLSNLFGINDFKNVELLKDFEIDNDLFSKTNLKECYKDLHNFTKGTDPQFQNLFTPIEDQYIDVSPCFNISKNPKCKGYCRWHKEIATNWSTQKIESLLR